MLNVIVVNLYNVINLIFDRIVITIVVNLRNDRLDAGDSENWDSSETENSIREDGESNAKVNKDLISGFIIRSLLSILYNNILYYK